MTDLMNKTFVANGGTTEDGKWRYEDANNLVTELENRITKPADPSHLDLLAFITNDWAKVAQSWASGDLLFVNDNSGTLEWKRLPKGTDGQILQLASGLPSWQNVSVPREIEYVHGVNYLPLIGGKEVLTSQVAETTYTGTDTEQTIFNLTLTEALNTKFTTGKSFFISTKGTVKSTASYTYYAMKNQTVGSAYYIGGNFFSAYYYAPSVNKINEYTDIGYLPSTYYIADYATETNITYRTPTYSDNIKLCYKLPNTGTTLYFKDLYMYLLGYTLASGTTYTVTDSIMDLYPEWELTGFRLYDTGDVLEVNGKLLTSYPYTPTINAGFSGVAQGSTYNVWNTVYEDMSEITSIKIVSGNPSLYFKQV